MPTDSSKQQPSRRIVLRLAGGLGNQLFQYAAASRLASANDVPLELDPYTGFAADSYERSFRLAAFNIQNPILDPGECQVLAGAYVVSRKFRRYREQQLQKWAKRNFDPWFYGLKIRSTAVVEGWWQSDRYFFDIAPALRKELRLRLPLTANGQKVAERIAASGVSISVHVRLMQQFSGGGNQVSKRKAVVLSPDYYREAVAFIKSVRGAATVFLFSDNPEAAKALQFPCPVEIVSSESAPDYEDLFLMSQCDHHVIANSTFSWWGAWLGDSRGIVCAPRVFVPFEDMVTAKDAYPENWRVIG